MWIKQKLRRLFLLSLLACLFLQPALGQATSSVKPNTQSQSISLESFLETENTQRQNSTVSLGGDLQNSTQSENSSTQLGSQSMNAATLLNNQETLLDSLEAQWTNLQLQLQTLETLSSSLSQDNEKLQTMLSSSSETTSDLKMNLESYKKTLILFC